jgi:hypothetical protein
MIRMDGGQWTPASRQGYNLRDAIARYTLQVPLTQLLAAVHLDLLIFPTNAITIKVLLPCHYKKHLCLQSCSDD